MNNEKIKKVYQLAQDYKADLIKPADFFSKIETLVREAYKDGIAYGVNKAVLSVESGEEYIQDKVKDKIGREAVKDYIKWFNKTAKIDDSEKNWWSYKEYLSSQVKEGNEVC